MNIKKIISIGLCALTLSTSASLPAFAAKSADPNNLQIVNKVEQFNKSRLNELDYYIWQIGTKNCITSDLIALYNRLDKLIVPNIHIANSLITRFNQYNANSIGSQIDLLFAYLYQLNTNLKLIDVNKLESSKISDAEVNAKKVICTLNSKIDQIEAINE